MSSPSPEPQQRRPYRTLPVADVLAQIKAHHGNVSRIAEHFGVQRTVIYTKLRAKPTLAQAIADERERLKDMAESNVYAALLREERWATAFVLTTIAKDRGWALAKNGVFAEGEPGNVTTVSVQAINIQTIEHNRFAEPGTESVHIAALPPPPEPTDDESDTLLIEGEFTKADDDQ